MKRINRKLRKAFTLLEILIVLLIIGLIAALVAPKILQRGEEAKIQTTKVQEKQIAQALKLYKLDTGMYPTTEQGLKALVEKPIEEPIPKNYKGPYLDEVPKDAWGNNFTYISPGLKGEAFVIISAGPDQVLNTKDDIIYKGK